jgi:hypothetical protein
VSELFGPSEPLASGAAVRQLHRAVVEALAVRQSEAGEEALLQTWAKGNATTDVQIELGGNRSPDKLASDEVANVIRRNLGVFMAGEVEDSAESLAASEDAGAQVEATGASESSVSDISAEAVIEALGASWQNVSLQDSLFRFAVGSFSHIP